MSPIVARFEEPVGARAELARLKAKRDDLAAKIKQLATAALKETCAEIFRVYQNVERFAWVQWSSEYDDNGPYTGINSVQINNEFDTDDGGYGSGMYEHRGSGINGAIRDSLMELGEDILMETLGGHTQVVVTREGIFIEEWHY